MTTRDEIRIVIVDDVLESRENLERLLSFEPDLRVVGKASRAEEGIELALRLQPHVVLLDQTLPDLDGLEASAAITTRAPGIGVILLGIDNDPETLRRAMHVGAREYLPKPFGYEELVTAVRRVARLANPVFSPPARLPDVSFGMPAAPAAPVFDGVTRPAQVIAVLGSKGGVGRTFLAANLAVTWRRLFERDVVLVDAHLSRGDVGVVLNLPAQRSWADVTRVRGTIDQEFLQELLTRHASRIRVLLAPGHPEEAEQIRAEHVQQVLSELRNSSDIVVIDTPGGYDDITLACADAATVILWVLTLEMTAIKETKIFLEIAERLGYRQKRIILILNRASDPVGLDPDEVERSLRTPIPIRIPSDAATVLRSINEGSPLAWTMRQHRIVSELERLVHLIETEEAEAIESPMPRRRRVPLPRLGLR